jgi:FAD/FMN-containing dehydrogenase
MKSATLRTRGGSSTTVEGGEIAELAASLAGDLLTAEHPDYDEARSVWNAMIDKRPALIVRCKEAADAAVAVRFARRHDLLLAVKGAGHNIAGRATCDGGIVIDFAKMREIVVNADARTARVEAGCTLGDVDAATQPFGLVVPAGINSTTGIAGLTLGGGFGWLSRKYGLTVDSLLSVRMVTVEGEEVSASKTENPDLFWAIRGGGGNFGIVTSFEFTLRQAGPEVLSGLVVHPLEDAGVLLREYRKIVAGAPEELSTWVVLRKAPPLPFLPAEWHGRNVLIFAACYVGEMDAGERALKGLRELGTPIADVISPHNFAAWQQAFDPLLTPGFRNYWKSHDLKELEDGAIETLVDYAGRVPSDATEIFLAHLGGAVNRIAAEDTAYPHRDVEFVINVHTRWADAEEDATCISWAREFFDAAAPFATGGVYVNFMPTDEMDRTGGAYGPNLNRLTELKRRYDPDNFLSMNQNIPPAPGA